MKTRVSHLLLVGCAVAALLWGAAVAQDAAPVCQDGYEVCGTLCIEPQYVDCVSEACQQKNDTVVQSLVEQGLVDTDQWCTKAINACEDAFCDQETQSCADGVCRYSSDVFSCGSGWCEKDEVCTTIAASPSSSSSDSTSTCSPLVEFCGAMTPEAACTVPNNATLPTYNVLKGPHQSPESDLFSEDPKLGQFSAQYICDVDCSTTGPIISPGGGNDVSDDSAAVFAVDSPVRAVLASTAIGLVSLMLLAVIQ